MTVERYNFQKKFSHKRVLLVLPKKETSNERKNVYSMRGHRQKRQRETFQKKMLERIKINKKTFFEWNHQVAQNALNDSREMVRRMRDVSLQFSLYFFAIIFLQSVFYTDPYPTMIRRRRKKTRTHTQRVLQRERLACILRKKRFTWIYLLLDHLIRKM